MTFEKFMKLDRIPCSSILIKIERGPTDKEGKPILLDTVKYGTTKNDAVATKLPKYSTGKYNTSYHPISEVESIIFEAKNERDRPQMKVIIRHLKDKQLKDKKYVKKIKKQFKLKNGDDITDEQFLRDMFLEQSRSRDELLPLNYFSSYISEIGFNFSLDLAFN